MGYDSGGRLLTSNTAGLTTSYAYDTGGRTVTRTENAGAGLTTSYEYDEAGRLLRTTSPGGKTWEYRYDALGRRVRSVDPSSICEAVELTVDGRVSARRWRDGADCEAGPLWAWEEYAYDAVGRQTATTAHRFGHGDPQGLPAAMEPPDDDHQLSSTTEYWELTDPAQGAVTGLVQLIRDPLGRETRFFYDEAGREQRRLLPDGTEIVTQYYPDGKVHLRTVQHTGGDEPWSLTTETRYDDQGRVRQVIEPDGSTTSSFYDELGRKVSTDRAGRVTTWRYSADGREVTETRPDQASITRRYDERGNLVEYSDHESNLTTYAYDDLGRLTDIFYPSETPGQSEVDPSRHITYTADGEVQTITRANGEVVTFHYEEPTGRLQWVDVDGVEVARYTYDAMGRVLTATTPDTTLAFTWDSLGQQLSEELGIDEQIAAGFGTHIVERRFDDGGRVYAVGETGAVLHRAWDSGDRLVGLDPATTWPTVPPAPDADLSGWAWRATQAGQRLLAVERGNGLTTTREHRSDGLPTEITTGVAVDGEIADPIHRLGLDWNADRLRASKSRADLNQKVLSFHYDGAGHLESASPTPPFAVAETDHDLNALLDGIPDAPAQPWTLTEDWHVSAVDELVKRRRRTEGRVEALDPTYNHLHQLEATGDGTAYTWSADGNLESKIVEAQDGTVLEHTSYTHDWRDRLVQVVLDHQGATHDIVLDALGRMVAKRVTGPGIDRTRVYRHDGDQVIAEYVTAPGGGMHLERRHHWAQWIDDLAIEQVDTDADGALDTTLWPITDLLGSVQLLTDEDGRIVERIAYDSDGTPHFHSEDTAPPEVVRVAWRASDATLHVGLSEVVDSERAEGIVATLGGDALAVELAPGGRGLVLSAATPTAGVAEALQLSGVYDRTGNQLIDTVSLTLADPAADESLVDTRAPEVLAVIEEADGLVVVFDEPVEPPDGVALEDTLGVVRTSSTPVTTVAGTTTQLAPTILRWTADDGQPWSLGSTYHLAEAQLVDTAGRDADVDTTFVHEIMADDEALVVYSAPSEGAVRASSAWGVTTLFQGREWHRDLGLYYFRARWYSPELGFFLQEDPAGFADGQSAFQALRYAPLNYRDPLGLLVIDRASSGILLRPGTTTGRAVFFALGLLPSGAIPRIANTINDMGAGPGYDTNYPGLGDPMTDGEAVGLVPVPLAGKAGEAASRTAGYALKKVTGTGLKRMTRSFIESMGTKAAEKLAKWPLLMSSGLFELSARQADEVQIYALSYLYPDDVRLSPQRRGPPLMPKTYVISGYITRDDIYDIPDSIRTEWINAWSYGVREFSRYFQSDFPMILQTLDWLRTRISDEEIRQGWPTQVYLEDYFWYLRKNLCGPQNRQRIQAITDALNQFGVHLPYLDMLMAYWEGLSS